MTRCAPCGATWGGLRIAHCAACHRTFTTPANFDRHRAGRRLPSNVVVGTGTCARPVDIGLVQNGRGQWQMPGRPDGDDERVAS